MKILNSKPVLQKAFFCSTFIYLTGLCLSSLSVQADMTARIHIASDYVYRGVSQTSDGQGYQGLLSYQFEPGVFMGASASRVEYSQYDNRDREISYFLGYETRFSKSIAFDGLLLHHTYPGSDPQIDFDWDELLLSIYVRDRWALSWGLADNWMWRNKSSSILELTYQHPLPLEIVLDTTLGYQNASKLFNRNYAYTEIGLSRSFEHLSLRLAYSATENDARYVFKDRADARWIGNVGWTF